MFFGLHIEWLIRITLAGFFGLIIGYERHSRSKEAGVRTHTIVALASAMLMILSKYGFGDAQHFDAARIAAQIVSGIGFLGAGIIFVRHDTIQGLTTAAGIWGTSGIGMCFGAGLYEVGIFSALLMIAVQIIFQNQHLSNATRTSIRLILKIEKSTSVKDITILYKKLGYICTDIQMKKDPEEIDHWVLITEVTTLKDVEPAQLLTSLRNEPFILHVDLAE